MFNEDAGTVGIGKGTTRQVIIARGRAAGAYLADGCCLLLQLLVVGDRTVTEVGRLVVAAVLPGNGHIVGVVVAEPGQFVLALGGCGEDGQVVVAAVLCPIDGLFTPVAVEVALKVGVVLCAVDAVRSVVELIECAGTVPGVRCAVPFVNMAAVVVLAPSCLSSQSRASPQAVSPPV